MSAGTELRAPSRQAGEEKIAGGAPENLLLVEAVSLLRGGRVLIVEDNWVIASSVRSLVEDVGMVIAGRQFVERVTLDAFTPAATELLCFDDAVY